MSERFAARSANLTVGRVFRSIFVTGGYKFTGDSNSNFK